MTSYMCVIFEDGSPCFVFSGDKTISMKGKDMLTFLSKNKKSNINLSIYKSNYIGEIVDIKNYKFDKVKNAIETVQNISMQNGVSHAPIVQHVVKPVVVPVEKKVQPKEDIFNIDEDIDQMEKNIDLVINCVKSPDKFLSHFISNKTTYLRIRANVIKGTLKESNIPVLFSDKYQLFRFMEINNLAKFNTNDNAENEAKVFKQLYCVIDSNEWDKKGEDPIDKVEEEYQEICSKLVDYFEENGGVPQSERKVHEILNKHSENDLFGV